MKKIILASASPQRKVLLAQLIGNDFEVSPSSYGEGTVEGLSPEELAVHHARKKAREVAQREKEGLIISADTLVVCNDEILGKPISEERAKATLEKISGQVIMVISGVTLLDIGTNKEISFCETTLVHMKHMSPLEIASYVESGEPLEKAGALAIQGKGASFVEKIDGDHSNVIGLPLLRLARMMEQMEHAPKDELFP